MNYEEMKPSRELDALYQGKYLANAHILLKRNGAIGFAPNAVKKLYGQVVGMIQDAKDMLALIIQQMFKRLGLLLNT